MTDLETVAEALSADEETAPAGVLGRFPDADAEYTEARALVKAWLGSAVARVAAQGEAAAGHAGDQPATSD